MLARKKQLVDEEASRTQTEDNKKYNYSIGTWTIIHLILTILLGAGTLAYYYEKQVNVTNIDKAMKYDDLLAKFDAINMQYQEQQTNFHEMQVRMEKIVPSASIAIHEPCAVCDYSKCLRLEDCPNKCPQTNDKAIFAKSGDVDKQLQIATKKSDLLLKKITPMQNIIQTLSKEQLLHKYGAEPYIVDISVIVPTSPDVVEVISIELAPIELMPYTILYFLNQVHQQAWDGCAFMRNARHVIQAGVTSVKNEVVKTCKNKNFEAAQGGQWASVVFQEYSANYPHTKYTIGLAGRPGGPDFYISTEDNTHNHGPGGQGQYGLAGEADACFAKVIDSDNPKSKNIDIIKRIHALPLKTEAGYEYLEQFVKIVSIRLRR